MPWQWRVWGKHPAFKDYFHLGTEDPLFQGMVEWMRNGYSQIKINRPPRNFFSWRFWMRGLTKESLACGLLRDSSDYLGRPHPILMMGTGALANWEKYWDLLPLAFEPSWSQMESLMAKSFKELKGFAEEILHIPVPLNEWEKMGQRREEERGNSYQSIGKQMEEKKAQNSIYINLNQDFGIKPVILISLYHYYWKKQGEPIPYSIFMGGSLARTFLAFFCRPLQPKDFQDLWSDSIGDR